MYVFFPVVPTVDIVSVRHPVRTFCLQQDGGACHAALRPCLYISNRHSHEGRKTEVVGVLLGNGTVKPVLRDHCHERPPVLKDHIFLVEGHTFQHS